jgi:predicted SnoaL-like aldol condensation-catalyzing enzyme
MASAPDEAQVEKNKEGVKAYFIEVIQDGKTDLIADFLSPSYTFNGQKSAAADNVAWIKSLHEQYGAFTIDIVRLLGAGDKVGIHWRANVPADPEKNIKAGYLEGMNVITCAGGQAVDNVQVGDMQLHSR